MEIYLSHMMIFRIVEKLGIHKMFGNGLLQYVVTVVVVLVGSVLFAVVMQYLIQQTAKLCFTKGEKL